MSGCEQNIGTWIQGLLPKAPVTRPKGQVENKQTIQSIEDHIELFTLYLNCH